MDGKTDIEEFKSFFSNSQSVYSFKNWFISDGNFVNKGDSIYEYSLSPLLASVELIKLGGQLNLTKTYIHKAENNGYVDKYFSKHNLNIPINELMYIIRQSDNKRIERKFKNIPKIIVDDFNNSKTIKWEQVSSKSSISQGIKLKSDDSTIDFVFSFNFIQANDYIIFRFNPKQIKPKQNDKINLLFNNEEKIEFELTNNPISLKNELNEKVLEYKSLITESELDFFANVNLKKWKITLKNDSREILGGEIGGNENYESKNNLTIAIKKFATEYINLVKKTISNYQPTEIRQSIKSNNEKTDSCFVYLMHDVANGYYKIGISNKPEYRERTLQSEKPTIEMIASKKFPIRKIAESFEKALHETYSEKRIRGEWFELNSTDIEHLKEALK